MKKILSIISSPRGAVSASIQLAQALTDQIVAAYPGSTVKTTDLTQKNFPHLEESYLRFIFGFIGLTDITVFRVEGLAIPGVKDTAMEKAIAGISLSSAN
jgi:FMN-dependent NADH-azoreductase